MSGSARVYVVDDDEAVRRSIAYLLESVGLVTEVFDSAEAVLAAPRWAEVGCFVVDLRLRGMSGLELQRALAARGCELPVILVTAHGEVEAAVRALKAGALDFLQKPFSDIVLLERVREALVASEQRREAARRLEGLRRRYQGLTPRERDVLAGIVAGRATKEVAATLGISPRTAEVHRASVMRKMQARSLAELVQGALRLGLVAPEEPPTPS